MEKAYRTVNLVVGSLNMELTVLWDNPGIKSERIITNMIPIDANQKEMSEFSVLKNQWLNENWKLFLDRMNPKNIKFSRGIFYK